MSERYTFSELLRQFLARSQITQEELGQKIGDRAGTAPIHRNTIGAWVRGDRFPRTRGLVQALAQVLFLSGKDADALLQAYPGHAPLSTGTAPLSAELSSSALPLPAIWMIPFSRNPYFTGREDLLERLSATLHAGQAAALSQPQAVSGLGGVGKTQLALEYVYRWQQDYQAVFWARAETRDTLIADFVTMARLLHLPSKDEKDQSEVIRAVQEWFRTHEHWLLILDNADDLSLTGEFVPTASTGHVLLTTRAASPGRLARLLEVSVLSREQSALLLLRRAGVLAVEASLAQAAPEDVVQAYRLVEEMGGLPLALDQAGAYIEETRINLADYWNLYHQHGTDLLHERRGAVRDYPASVATTWSLSFQRAKEQNAAADLLRFCAFLAPDAIAEEILPTGASQLGPVLAPVVANALLLNRAIAVLRSYSLVQRDPREKTLSIHRLVAVVLRQSMERTEQRTWFTRAMRFIDQAFPTGEIDVPVAQWEQCDRLLPHACHCLELSTAWENSFPELVSLLLKTAGYLQTRTHYTQARRFYLQALALCEREHTLPQSQVAACLYGLALLSYQQGDYSQAEQFCQRALSLCEPDGADAAISQKIRCAALLGQIYWSQTRYAEAQLHCEWALRRSEQEESSSGTTVATCLMILAAVYNHQKRIAEAESLGLRACALYEQTLGPSHPYVACVLVILSALYRRQGRSDKATSLGQRAVRICEQVAGPMHPYTANSLTALALSYRTQGQYREAEDLCVRALAIREQTLGSTHPHTISSLAALALLSQDQGRMQEARSFWQRVQTLIQQAPGSVLPLTQELLMEMGRFPYES